MYCMTNNQINRTKTFNIINQMLDAPPTKSRNYNLVLLSGGFTLMYFKKGLETQLESLLIFLGDPAGNIIIDAHFITTIVDPRGVQQIRHVRSFKGGYLIDTEHLNSGKYRLDLEIATNGLLLTDNSYFYKT